jgi:hypothetical protein
MYMFAGLCIVDECIQILYWDGIHESSILLSLILRFVFLQNASHEQT